MRDGSTQFPTLLMTIPWLILLNQIVMYVLTVAIIIWKYRTFITGFKMMTARNTNGIREGLKLYEDAM